MKSLFLTELDYELKHDRDDVWVLMKPLLYYSELLNTIIIIPSLFESDGSSVPRMPIAYWFYGGKCHREGFLHDYLFRKDSIPVVPFGIANALYLEAMESRNKPVYVRYPMWAGVWIGGYPHYHKKKVFDKL